MSIEEDSFFINAVPPFDFDEINEFYCWDGSEEDESLLHDLDTMVCVEIKELNESLPKECNQEKSIIDYTIQLNKKKHDPFHITLPPHLKKRHQCDICYKKYARTSTLTKHKQRHKKFKCEICNDEFNAKTPLSRHLAKFHKKTVPCDFCTNKFYTVLQLAEHFQKKHDKELRDEEQENNTEEKNNIYQNKNPLDSELKLTLDSFSSEYNKDNEFSDGLSENCIVFSNYTASSQDYSHTDSTRHVLNYYPQYLPNSPQHTPNSPQYTSNSPQYTPNSPQYTSNSPQYTPNSPQYTPNSPQYTSNSPQYTPNSPQYTPNSPQHTPNSPQYTPNSPQYTSNSPQYTPNSPQYTPNSPQHTPNSPQYTPNSPQYTPNSPKYTPNSPKYTPNSPKYTPKSSSPKLAFKEDILSDLPEINMPEKNVMAKPQKTMKDFFKTIEKH